jgi:hypothetical protein
MDQHRCARAALSRRQFLAGSLAGGLAAASGAAGAETKLKVRRPAKHVIFVLMSGAPSQFETFDPKPGTPTGGPFGTIANAGNSRFEVPRPSFGSIVAHLLGKDDAKLPGYINLSGSWNDAAFQGAGFLGPRYDMMKVPGLGKLSGATARPEGVSETGFRARDELRDVLGREFLRDRKARPAQQYEESFVRARGLMESTSVFDLSREPAGVRDRYGPTRYGADCLTARRLIEAGVPFVLIQCFGTRCDWDWHYEAFSHLSKYIYGGRAHWGRSYSMIVAGGPIRGGQVIGKTSKDGSTITDRPVTIPELYRAWYPALGINPDKKLYVSGQPVPVQEEGKQAVAELLA